MATERDLCPLVGELDLIKSADGSALITDKACGTQILVTLFGPGDEKETHQLFDKLKLSIVFVQQENMIDEEVENAEIFHQSAEGNPFNEEELIVNQNVVTKTPTLLQEKFIEKQLTQVLLNTICLNEFPRAALSLKIQVLQNCGRLISNTINASILALIDAGIPMKTTPLALEYTPDNTTFCFILDRRSGYKNVLQSIIDGYFDPDLYKDALEYCQEKLCNDYNYRSLHLKALKHKLCF